jgi:hypothetical protein
VRAPGGPPIADVFAGEERDPAWAAPMEATLRRRAGEILAGLAEAGAAPVRAEDAECRSRTCRVGLSSADPDALAGAISRFSEDDGIQAVARDMIVVATQPSEGGPRAVALYLRAL